MMTNNEIYAAVTDRILECLEKGVVPWRKPWAVASHRNLSSRHVYKGINQILLSCTAFASPYWVTLNQANQLGGKVKRGERGTPIVFWKIYEKEKASGEVDKRFVLKRFTIFNAEQTEGIYVPSLQAPQTFNVIENCEKIVDSFENGPSVEHGGGRACYAPSLDKILMPPKPAFTSSEEYYSTLFHEFVHSTGAPNRLARKGVTDPSFFASHDYSQEELVAECGAAFLCAEAGISPATLTNSAAYIASWAKQLRHEPKWILNAASQAAKAADLILGRARERADCVDDAA
ncbi:MAG: zincin-like metallopeptidase domain-containing protein [Pseudomonadota bacterium]